MNVDSIHLCLDAYNISGITYNKLLTLVTSGSWEWVWVESAMFTFNLKKEKQNKAEVTLNGEDLEKLNNWKKCTYP